MYYIIYLSSGTRWFSEAELKDILVVSNVNNTTHNITGLLLYRDGNFIQLLEGEEEDVQKTFQKISDDQRHKGITPIASGQIKERNFPNWAMGFKTIDSENLSSFLKYLNYDDSNTPKDKVNKLPVTLLKAFIRAAAISAILWAFLFLLF